MKKILFIIYAVTASLGISAQTVKCWKNGEIVAAAIDCDSVVFMENEVFVESIIISAENNKTAIRPSERLQLTAKILPENANDKSLIWISSDPQVATVDESGLVTGHLAGEITITAKNEASKTEGTYSIMVEVVDPEGLTRYSPVGTIGMFGGREAIVVNLGGTFGKVAIETKNYSNSATYYFQYGQNKQFFEENGWYIPNIEVFGALVALPHEWDETRNGWVWKIEDNELFLPATGYIKKDRNGGFIKVYPEDKKARYWVSTQVSGHLVYYYYFLYKDVEEGFSFDDCSYYCAFRLFGKLM